MNHTILLTFDVEDWFQVENFKQCIPFSSWPICELRVEKNVHRILDLLDSINCSTAVQQHRSTAQHESSPCLPSARLLQAGAMHSAPCGTLRATFFVLGWLAERLPHLVSEIQKRGHEVASHGYGHILCREQSADDLTKDLLKSKKLLEDITGNSIYGYRAPSFSIDQNILSLIEDSGYLYDSSFNSFSLNRRYGQVKFSNNGENGISVQISETFYELPISNLKIAKQVIPWGGGGYFRLIPAQLFKYGVQSILKNQGAYLFYLHPWEIDREQPQVPGVKKSLKLRHYLNLDNTYSKLSSMLNCFKQCHFSTLIQYINHQTQQTQVTRNS